MDGKICVPSNAGTEQPTHIAEAVRAATAGVEFAPMDLLTEEALTSRTMNRILDNGDDRRNKEGGSNGLATHYFLSALKAGDHLEPVERTPNQIIDNYRQAVNIIRSLEQGGSVVATVAELRTLYMAAADFRTLGTAFPSEGRRSSYEETLSKFGIAMGIIAESVGYGPRGLHQLQRPNAAHEIATNASVLPEPEELRPFIEAKMGKSATLILKRDAYASLECACKILVGSIRDGAVAVHNDSDALPLLKAVINDLELAERGMRNRAEPLGSTSQRRQEIEQSLPIVTETRQALSHFISEAGLGNVDIEQGATIPSRHQISPAGR